MQTDQRKTALVTGSSRGIGRAIALKLSALGYDIAINYFKESEEGGLEVAREAQALGSKTLVFEGAVSSETHVSELFARIQETFGRLDVLVNNAGITRDKSFLKMTPAMWNEVIQVNLNGAYLCSQSAVPLMIDRQYGRIVKA